MAGKEWEMGSLKLPIGAVATPQLCCNPEMTAGKIVPSPEITF